MDDDLGQARAQFQECLMGRDQQRAARLLDDEFALVLVAPRADRMPRERWLELLPDYVIHDWTVEEAVTDVDGDLAAVLQRVAMHATVLGQDRSGVFVLTDLWCRRDGSWRLWRRHSSPLTAGALPGGTVA